MSTMQKDDLLQQRGQHLLRRRRDRIGKIEEIYLDPQSGEPEWALVNTGMFGTKSTFVALQGAGQDGDTLRVPYGKAQVKDAPKVDPDGEPSQSQASETHVLRCHGHSPRPRAHSVLAGRRLAAGGHRRGGSGAPGVRRHRAPRGCAVR